MRYLVIASVALLTSSFNTEAQQLPQTQDMACIIAVINVTESIAMQVHLVHEDVEKVYPEYIYPNDVWSVKVPCKSKTPVAIMLRNVADPADFVARELEVPPPGTVRAWCIGPTERCEALARQGKAKTEPITMREEV